MCVAMLHESTTAKNESDMQAWIDAVMRNARSYDSVSAPLAVQHKVHGGFDGEKGFTVRLSLPLHMIPPPPKKDPRRSHRGVSSF